VKRMMTVTAVAVLAACGPGDGQQQQRSDGAPPAAGNAVPQAPPAASGTADSARAAGTQTAAASGADGAAVYGRTCVTCHQANGQGMAGAFPPLSNSEYVTGDKNRMIRIVLHGLQGPITVNGQQFNNVMAPWKQLSDAEIAAVISYVRSNFGNNASAVTAQEVAAQRQATASRTGPYTVAELNR